MAAARPEPHPPARPRLRALGGSAAARGLRQLAAVDLGSNSFHYVIAALVGSEPEPIDRHREQVQLARGLCRRTGQLGRKAQARALACLRRFAERLAHIPSGQVRVVGTSTLRRARNARAFLAEAEQALGHEIEVVSGREEARLIFLGVSHGLPDHPGPRCVVDIGGGSTEVVVGTGFEAQEMHSLPVGCVDYARRFFRKGEISARGFDRAVLEAARVLRPARARLRDLGWDEAVGSSGTIKAVAQVLRAAGRAADGIGAADLRWLRRALLRHRRTQTLALDGLKRGRAAVFPAGVAILTALFDRLPLEPLKPARGALREGVLYDLLGRIRREDVRERTIRAFQQRYRVDDAQASRVERTALALLLHAPAAWGLDPVADGRLLAWAARLTEIGLAVGLDGYPRHSAYLVAHGEMPGFGREEQRALAFLVGAQRGKLRRAELDAFPVAARARRLGLALLLRWAVLLNRARSPEPLPPVRIEGDREHVLLRFPPGWLGRHALTRVDLEAEARALAPLGLTLEAPVE